jgi:adenylate cyclase
VTSPQWLKSAFQRRLAVILAADVVGYSALMERAEEATYVSISRIRREVLEPHLSRYRGASSKRPVMACSLNLPVRSRQCDVRSNSRTTSSSIPDPLELRIRLNLDDVIVREDGDVHRETINMAARLERIADPGGYLDLEQGS